jgi:hypothetical protein
MFYSSIRLIFFGVATAGLDLCSSNSTCVMAVLTDCGSP